MSVPNPLFGRLFDYAGVFPPANLTVPAAVQRYRAALSGPDGWLLGPFLIRASQLGDLDADLPLGVVADVAVSTARNVLQVEGRTEPGEAGARLAVLRGKAPVVYLEGPDPAALDYLAALSSARRDGRDVRAKVRTGGATASAFPDPDTLARFIAACIDHRLPFKATAGLHHPFRTASDVPEAIEHGFVNLLAAVRVALSGHPGVADCLAGTDPDDFEPATATWKGVGAEIPAHGVRSLLRSIGSCSFDEPASYLRELGLLEGVG